MVIKHNFDNCYSLQTFVIMSGKPGVEIILSVSVVAM